MKYTIELTDNQKKQMDFMLDMANKHMGFNRKLEMVETTNVEDTNEYQIGYEVGYADGKADAIYNTDLLDELKKESIQVGDVVKFNEKCHSYDRVKSREFLVLHIFDNGLVTLLYDNGDTGTADINLLDKTSKHVDEVEQLLNKLKGE